MPLLMDKRKSNSSRGTVLPAIIMAVLLVAFGYGRSFAAKPKQETFSTPAQAVKTMVDAMKTGNTKHLFEIFGSGGQDLFFSGDDVADKQTREEFVKAYEEKNRLRAVGKNKVIVHVGKDDWPWPIPIVRVGQKWRFDTSEGRQEIFARRIGEDELGAIQVVWPMSTPSVNMRRITVRAALWSTPRSLSATPTVRTV